MPEIATPSKKSRRSAKSSVLQDPALLGNTDVNTAEPDELPQPESNAAPAPAGVVMEDDPDMPNQLRFFNFLRKQQGWDHLSLFLYRLEPRVQNSGKYAYIDVYSNPITENDIRKVHGGGKFLAILNDSERGEQLKKCVIDIAGQPILKPQQKVINADGTPVEEPAVLQVGTTVGPSSSDRTLAEVLTKALNLVAEQKKSPDDAVKIVLETVGQAQKAAIGLIADAAKRDSESTTGHPLLDKLLAGALENLAVGQRSDPMANFKTMLETMNQYQELMGGGSKKSGSLVEEMRAAAELLKGDTDGALKKLIFGRGEDDAEPASFGARALDLATQAIKERPDILSSVVGLLNAFTSRLMQPAVLPPAAPATLGLPPMITPVAPLPAAPVQTAPPQPAAPAAAVPGAQELMIRSILYAIVNGYNDQSTDESPEEKGAATADALCRLHPEVLPMLEPYIALPDAAILAWLRGQAPIAPIIDKPDFVSFFAGFVGYLRADGEPPADAPGEGTAPGPRIV